MDYDNTALDAYKAELAKPVAAEQCVQCDETFDPWEPLDCFYGSYSSAFDDVAIKVLRSLLEPTYETEDVACEMFREVLCRRDLCDYGTSPRGCFPTEEFREILPDLIAKWQEYYAMKWVA